jgi:hypothetical protein
MHVQHSIPLGVFDALLGLLDLLLLLYIIFRGWPGREAHAGDGVSVRASES